jgi:hypothetical protein
MKHYAMKAYGGLDVWIHIFLIIICNYNLKFLKTGSPFNKSKVKISLFQAVEAHRVARG